MILLWSAYAHADAYRWKDEQGKTHYSDRVPPEQSRQGRTKLNQQGMAVGVIEAAKSSEQWARENELRRLRSEQERLLAEQKDRDLSLLRTFRSLDEMYLTLRGKLTMIESAIKITTTNRQHQEELLEHQNKQAADFELKGQTVPVSLRNNIDATRRQIANYQDKIRQLEADKDDIAARFTRDIERWKTVKAQQSDQNGSLSKRDQLAATDRGGSADSIIISAIACSSGTICDQSWKLAKAYVQQQATTTIITETEKILQTAYPREDGDIALTVTRINSGKDEILFLDVHCRHSSLGEELCAGRKVRDIRSGFKQHIETGLKSAQF